MESLFSAEVIKAAASSVLGVLSLMCLILGAIAMAFFKKSQEQVRMTVFALLFFGVAGFGYSLMQQNATEKPPEVTREFIVGRWLVEQKFGDVEGGSYIVYNDDGSFKGMTEYFYQGSGKRIPVGGQWRMVQLSKDEFRITLKYDAGNQYQAVFKIIDKNRVQNVDENYLAVRTPK